jgi:hypothetical protein
MRRSVHPFAPAAMGLLLVTFACTTPMELGVVTSGPDSGTSGNQFGEQVDAGTPEASGPHVGLCATNECPAGRVTCPNNPFPCAVDLSSDETNCGACGNGCPAPSGTNAFATCMGGECKFACRPDFANCNGLEEDGCEANTSSDSNNCGACGNVCPSSQRCEKGSCVCAVQRSCGACGNVCPPSTEPPFPPEWNAERGCVQGQCNQPNCSGVFADCNGDFTGNPTAAGDGCETRIVDDPKNCGGCGVTCAPGEYCSGTECVCPCGSTCFKSRLNNDVSNCGACRVTCNGRPNSTALCDNGVCAHICAPNWGDCDGNIPGCETNLLSDPNNCGGCDIRCDGVDGQACVDGKCVTKDCEVVQ